MTPQDTATTLKARADANGRLGRLNLIALVVLFLVVVLAGLQSRHHWPLLVADAGYVLAVGIVAGAAGWIYRGQG